MLCAVSQLKDHVVFAWTSKGDLWHIMSPVAVVPPWGEYYPRLCTREQFEELFLVDVLLEQTQGGLALASNSYGYGGHFSHSLRLGAGNPISFTASVSPECEFVRWEFYAPGEETPFLTADTQFVNMHWTQAKNTVARVVTRPKDEYKLHLETKVTPTGTPGDDCPGYVVVEDAKTIGGISYHGPKRYYPKDGWVRLRPVANPGYRFVKWDAKTAVKAAVLGPLGTRTEEVLRGLKKENVAVCVRGDTEITAVFEPYRKAALGAHGLEDPPFPVGAMVGRAAFLGYQSICPLGYDYCSWYCSEDESIISGGAMISNIVGLLRDARFEIFEFQGHSYGRNRLLLWDPSPNTGSKIDLTPTDVGYVNSPYHLVLLHACHTASDLVPFRQDWVPVLHAGCYIGWLDRLDPRAAGVFETAFWDHICDKDKYVQSDGTQGNPVVSKAFNHAKREVANAKWTSGRRNVPVIWQDHTFPGWAKAGMEGRQIETTEIYAEW